MLTLEKLDLKKQWKHLHGPPTGEITTVTVPRSPTSFSTGRATPTHQSSLSRLLKLSILSPTPSSSRSNKIHAPSTTASCPSKASGGRRSARLHAGGQIHVELDRHDSPAGIHLPRSSGIHLPRSCRRRLRRSPQKEKSRGARPCPLRHPRRRRVRADALPGSVFRKDPVVQRIHDAISAAGKELYGKHHEIYLSDPRRTAPAKLRTILRQPMR